MPNRNQLNQNLATVLVPVVEIPQHLQTYQMILDYVDASVSGMTVVASAHTHDDRYYTKQQVDAIATTKSNVGHTHNITGITGIESSSLVAPSISVAWGVYQNNETTFITSATTKSITVESGSKVSVSASYQYPTPNTGQSGPASVTG